MNEKSLWEWLRDVALPIGHYSRIESPDTAPGFPDVHYTFEGHTGTLELKYAQHVDPPFPNGDSGLRTAQLRWIREEIKEGGAVWIVAEIDNKHHSVILVIDGVHAAHFNGASMDDLYAMAEQRLHRKNLRESAAKMEGLLRVK